MELSEAKDIFKEWLEYNKGHKDEIRKADTIIAVQETILKALDNSIPKEKIEKKIETLEFLRDDAIEDNHLADARNLKERIEVLQELLGE